MKKLLRAIEVAEFLGISKSTAYAYISQGILPSVVLPSIESSVASKKNRNFVRVRIEDVENFIHNCSKEGLSGRSINNGNY